MNLIKYIILSKAIFLKQLLRFFVLGGGTALPGLFVEKFVPHILNDIANNFQGKIIVISGTNGKTTVTNTLVNIVSSNGIPVISNNAGSNLHRGIISAYLDALNNFGKFVKNDSMMILEVDEAILASTCKKLKPSIIMLLNLFRDQLDRYGEIDTIRKNWLKEFSLSYYQNTHLIVNTDDYLLSEISKSFSGEVTYYGIEDSSLENNKVDHTIETCYCNCGIKIDKFARYYGHLGKWKCIVCDNQRTKPQIYASNIQQDNLNLKFDINDRQDQELKLLNLGVFSVYNYLAAITASLFLNIHFKQIAHALSQEKQIFGRQETFLVKNKTIKLFLVKNPIGLNQVIQTLNTLKKKKLNILFALNNQIEDGIDVSWIYDADIEMIVSGLKNLVISGDRADDLALRFALGGRKEFIVEKNLKNSIDFIIDLSAEDSEIYLLLTYSAMMKYRKYLVKISGGKPFWAN